MSQARKDALADAETLRLFAREVWEHVDLYSDEASNLPILIDMAGQLRRPGSRFMRAINRSWWPPMSRLYDAVAAARRAVPALGDE